MSDIFISYANEDSARAQLFAQAIEAQGWTVWWDRNIPPGRTFDEVIAAALEQARCVVVLWSEASVKSRWVKEEAADATGRGILIPALIDQVPLPLGFRRIEAAKLIGWSGDSGDPEFQQLLAAIGTVIQAKPKPVTAPPKPPVGTGPAPRAAKPWPVIYLAIAVAVISGALAATWLWNAERGGTRDIASTASSSDMAAQEAIRTTAKPIADGGKSTPAQTPIPVGVAGKSKALPVRRLADSAKIRTRNTARPAGDKRWDWTVFLEADSATLSNIDCVEYTLHQSFADPVRRICDAKDGFALSSNGWGTFEIKIRAEFSDGSVKRLAHTLRFN